MKNRWVFDCWLDKRGKLRMTIWALGNYLDILTINLSTVTLMNHNVNKRVAALPPLTPGGVHSLGLAAGPVLAELQQVDDSLSQQLVWTHQGPVQDVDMERGSLRASPSISLLLLRQVESGLLLPDRGHALLHHRGLVLLLAHLHDRVRIVGAAFPLYPEASGLEHRYLGARGTPQLIRQGHADATCCGIRPAHKLKIQKTNTAAVSTTMGPPWHWTEGGKSFPVSSVQVEETADWAWSHRQGVPRWGQDTPPDYKTAGTRLTLSLADAFTPQQSLSGDKRPHLTLVDTCQTASIQLHSSSDMPDWLIFTKDDSFQSSDPFIWSA